MFGKKVFAAMLATVLGASLFGANAAKAVIDLDTDSGAVTYAMETLDETVAENDDYYVVTGDTNANDLDVMGMVGLAGPTGSFVTVRFDLRGMVFNDAPSLDFSPSYGTPSLRTGGAGKTFVSFIAPRPDNAAEDMVTLTVNGFGVKPGVSGSVTMTVTDSLGDDALYTENFDGAVRTEKALMEIPMPMDLGATVQHRFMSFNGLAMGTVGSFMVDLVPGLANAASGVTIVELSEIIATGTTSSVTISGDFSFASMAWLQTAPICASGAGLAAEGRRNGDG